jgi:zinc transport system substrate-binding protein
MLALVTVAVACHHGTGDKPLVVTTIFPVYDLTRRIAGDDAEVIMLVPLGASPHRYQGADADPARITGAKLAVLIGLDLDSWVKPIMDRVSPKGRVVKLADRVPTLPRRPAIGGEAVEARHEAVRERSGAPAPDDEIDVHVWLDPQRALLMARAISDELCRVDSRHATAYRERALEVTRSLGALDHELEGRLVAAKGKSIATLHDAFRYYAARYGLDIAVSVEAYPGTKPPLHYDQLVLARLRDRKVAAVFGEPELDSQPAHTLAEVAHLPYGQLDPIGGALPRISYEALLRADTDALLSTLSSPLSAAGAPDTSAPPQAADGAGPPSP